MIATGHSPLSPESPKVKAEMTSQPHLKEIPPLMTRPVEVETLEREYSEIAVNLDAETGIALWDVGGRGSVLAFGDFRVGPAWSTMKVPLAIAALRNGDQASVTSAVEAAITQSDNVAADSLWQGLGDPQTAAGRVQAVLRNTGDEETVVQSERIHPPHSAFGQTMWTLENQTRFLASAACDRADAPVLELMGRVEPDQRWGLGHLDDVRFKGGWGPSVSGAYLVRQMGLIHTKRGLTAVAIAAAPSSGSFDDGTKILTVLAEWLSKRLDVLPAGTCP